MGRKYQIAFGGEASASAVDFLEILAPDAGTIVIRQIRISQSSEAGDAQAENLRFQLKKADGTFTSGSGGASATLKKTLGGDAAATTTAEQMNTTQAVEATGTLDTLVEESEPVSSGWYYAPAPEDRIHFAPGESCIVSLGAAPADSVTWSVYALIEELF